MGVSLYRRPNKPGGTYYGAIRWKGKRYPGVSLRTRDKIKAQREAARVEKSLEDGSFFRKSKKFTFDDFLKDYEDAYKTAPTDAERASRATSWVGSAKYGLDHFFAFCRTAHQVDRIDKVTPELAADFPDYRIEKGRVSVATSNANLRACKAAFGWAVKKKLIADNPFAEVKQKKLPSLEIHWLRQADAEAFRAAVIATEYAREAMLYLYAGLRLKEALTVRWESGVDFDANLVRILNQPDLGFLTKSRQQRGIPMAPELRALLLAWRDQDGGKDARGLICGKGQDRAMKFPQTVTHALSAIGKKIGLKVSPQVLRRTFGSILRQNRVPLDRISLLLGHSSVAVTERWYAGMDIDGDDTDVRNLSFERQK